MSSTGSLLARIGRKGTRLGARPAGPEDFALLDIRFEIGGRKLDPCFIGDSIEKATLLHVARDVRRKFSGIRVPDREDPLKVLIKGDDIDHLHYELEGPSTVLEQVREKMGIILHGKLPITV